MVTCLNMVARLLFLEMRTFFYFFFFVFSSSFCYLFRL